MSNYKFTIQDFKITQTRSRHDDTLIAGYGISVNGLINPIQCAGMGDFNNGTHYPSKHHLGSQTFEAGPTDRVVLVYFMINNGHDHKPNCATLAQNITTALQSGQAALAAKIATPGAPHPQRPLESSGKAPVPVRRDAEGADGDEPENGWVTNGENGNGGIYLSGSDWLNIFTGGLYAFFNWIFADCDGPVAQGALATNGLAAMIKKSPSQIYTQSDTITSSTYSYGKPSGCNSSGSHYVVTWTLQPA
jgi:hypothetical protein